MDLAKSRTKLKPQKRQKLELIDSFGESHKIQPQSDLSILELAIENSVDVMHSCGGMGTCGTCRIRLQVLEGAVPERGEIETEMANERSFASDERLSCQVMIPNDDFSWVAVALATSDES